MALTKVQAAGLTADLIDETKLADNSIDSEHYNDGSIDNEHLADDAVGIAELSATGTASSSTFLRGDNSWQTVSTTPEGTAVLSTGETGTAKFLRVDGDNSCSWQVPPDTNTTYSVGDGGLTQNNFTNTLKTKLDGIAASANAYVHPNHSGEVTSTADGATVIADDIVDEANLKISNAGSNGQFLSKQSGNTGGLTWAAVSSGKINAYQVTKLETDGTLTNPGNTFTEIPQTEVSYTPTTAASFLLVRCYTALYCRPHNMDNGGEEFFPRAGMCMKELNGSAVTLSSNILQRLNLYARAEPSDTSNGLIISLPCSFVGRLDVNNESWSSGAIKFCVGASSGWNYALQIQVNDYSSTVWEITEYSV